MRPLLVSSLTLVLAFASLSTAQAPPAAGGQLQNSAAQPEAPVFRTGARDVVVDVVVTDDKGNQVTGLRQSDFSIFEDKKPQGIDFFEEHTAKSLPPAELKPLPAMPPNVFTNVPLAPESDAVNVLLLDTLNTPEQDFAYARNQVIQFLHKVPPGTRMAIVVLSDKLTFVQGFTTDASALLKAVEDRKKGANPQTSTALISRSEEAGLEGTIAMRSENAGGFVTGMGSMGVNAVVSAYNSYSAFAQRNRMLMTLEALTDLARYLANVPGRKNLIWFSADFPVFIFPNLAERGDMQDLVEPVSLVRKTADALTAARVAVYPVNARGVMNDSVYMADSPGMANTTNGTRLGTVSPMSAFARDAAERSNVTAEMNQLAADTGGKATYNSNDLSTATGHAVADGSHYYTITYSPTNKNLDGTYRSIVVKTANGRYKLAYRRGYNADEIGAVAPAAPANPLQPLMRLGMPDSTEVLYGLRVTPAATQPALGAPLAGKNPKLAPPVTRYTIHFVIRFSDVHFSLVEGGKQKGKQWGRVQVELLAYDPNGAALNWTGGTQEMLLDPDTYASVQKSGIPAQLDIDVPQGKNFYLSTGVYDWRTGKAGTLQVPVHPATAQAAASIPVPASPAN